MNTRARDFQRPNDNLAFQEKGVLRDCWKGYKSRKKWMIEVNVLLMMVPRPRKIVSFLEN